MNTIDAAFIKDVESRHFRTDEDSGAGSNALMIWNMVRAHVGLQPLKKSDLPAYCVTHNCYHIIREDYGCKRKTLDTSPK